MHLTHAQLITELGGGNVIARDLGRLGHEVDREAVYQWKRNGIPHRWRPLVARLALAKIPPLPLPADFEVVTLPSAAAE